MLRSNTFNPEHEPLRHNTTFALNQDHTRGPVPFLNPTRARYEQYYNAAGLPVTKEDVPAEASAKDSEAASGKPKPVLTYQWTSRDNRKGRHRLIVPDTSGSQEEGSNVAINAPKPSNSLSAIAHNLWLMLVYYPIWDISFDVAYIFTWGSIIWVINGFFAFLPLVRPNTLFAGEALLGGGITAFIGATVFEIGSVLLLLEAVNAGQEGCFGWAVENAWYGNSSSASEETQAPNQQPQSNNAPADNQDNGDSRPALSEKTKATASSKSTNISVRPDRAHCTHHHRNKRNLVGRPPSTTLTPQSSNPPSSTTSTRTWTWLPTLSALRTHYIHDLGFLASLIQFFAATIFWIAGFTSLPGIYDHLSAGALAGAYWTPQIIGGLGFVTSGYLFMLETQTVWWRPAWRTLGWHIGLWNLVGGVGFTLCPAFGYGSASWRVYQASLSTFWGSWAFLGGSVVQWYESLQKYPVEVEKTGARKA
ncbi:MAG: hypothetical protein M1822_001009 [Bathelium mastoideum]|nr:MAG: hypothetical protein M1822_001009 [Bathelium mastoideum]